MKRKEKEVMNKIAILFGVTGQIGSYMLDLLLEKDYFVCGLARRVSSPNTGRIKHNLNNGNFFLQSCDLTDSFSVYRAIDGVLNTYGMGEFEIYNFAAQSFVKESFNQPGLTWDVTAKGHLNLLEAVRELSEKHSDKRLKTFFMSSSETFGSNVSNDGFQNEQTKMFANSPYGVAKLAAFNLSDIYRKSYGLDIRNGIIFNSESPRRSPEFVTKKITRWFAEYFCNNLSLPFSSKLRLGNLNAKRDWLHAKDTVRAIHAIMEGEVSEDFVISSGETRSIHDFLLACYNSPILNCCDKLPHSLEQLYEIDSSLYRPCEVEFLRGDSTKLRTTFGWKPEISFNELVEDMLISDIGDITNDKIKTEVRLQ